ncbi:MAG: hypothetical protein A3H32_16165 [Betaproteobacteria bacterium RIFCSPLOWO2_02_FULL_63_19]|nr:MAG: hypothetical protein A3H32_16165 [Betaproteobacteria bacterium RIFCSPLOWO2_02_FULL_63_19]
MANTEAVSPDIELEGSGRRNCAGFVSKLATATVVVVALYHLAYVARFFESVGIEIYAAQHRAASILSLLVVIFLYFPATKNSARDRLPWYDLLLIVCSVMAFGYGSFLYERVYWEAAYGSASIPTIAMTYLGIALMCEGGRRIVGLPMVVITAVLVLYSHVAANLPGILQATSFPPSMFAYIQYVSSDGIFGVPIGVFATIIMAFVLFANFLNMSGAGEFFLDLAFSLVGHIRGGPAKAAVIASALFGSISGSASANVASTGVITIPLMKKIGLRPEFAGGVEAAASTGGLFMPPVMGAVAYIMADWLNVPYLQVCVVALVPAILYYVAIYLMIDAEVLRLGLGRLSREELPSLGKTVRKGWYHLIPLVFLVTLLSLDYRADYAAFLSILVIVGLSAFRRETRMGPRKIARAMRDGIIGSLPAGISCALAGVILGALTMTAVGVKLSAGILDIADGRLYIALLLAAVTSLILGMGMPAVPIYIMLVILIAPGLGDMGVPLIAAHFFVYYYGALSFITPPVATAAFTASAIANSSPMMTAVHSLRIGIVAAVIPFVFAYNPGLLFIGTGGEIFRAILAGTLGVMVFVIGVAGYIMGERISWASRTVLIAAGILLYSNSWMVNIVGLAIAVPPLAVCMKRARAKKIGPVSEAGRPVGPLESGA